MDWREGVMQADLIHNNALSLYPRSYVRPTYSAINSDLSFSADLLNQSAIQNDNRSSEPAARDAGVLKVGFDLLDTSMEAAKVSDDLRLLRSKLHRGRHPQVPAASAAVAQSRPIMPSIVPRDVSADATRGPTALRKALQTLKTEMPTARRPPSTTQRSSSMPAVKRKQKNVKQPKIVPPPRAPPPPWNPDTHTIGFFDPALSRRKQKADNSRDVNVSRVSQHDTSSVNAGAPANRSNAKANTSFLHSLDGHSVAESAVSEAYSSKSKADARPLTKFERMAMLAQAYGYEAGAAIMAKHMKRIPRPSTKKQEEHEEPKWKADNIRERWGVDDSSHAQTRAQTSGIQPVSPPRPPAAEIPPQTRPSASMAVPMPVYNQQQQHHGDMLQPAATLLTVTPRHAATYDLNEHLHHYSDSRRAPQHVSAPVTTENSHQKAATEEKRVEKSSKRDEKSDVIHAETEDTRKLKVYSDAERLAHVVDSARDLQTLLEKLQAVQNVEDEVLAHIKLAELDSTQGHNENAPSINATTSSIPLGVVLSAAHDKDHANDTNVDATQQFKTSNTNPVTTRSTVVTTRQHIPTQKRLIPHKDLSNDTLERIAAHKAAVAQRHRIAAAGIHAAGLDEVALVRECREYVVQHVLGQVASELDATIEKVARDLLAAV